MKDNMTRRTRNILFLFLLILFLIAAPLTVLYCLGWRFDWETKKVGQPGVFYFKVWPKSAEVYLDNKLIKKTDFFFGSVLIENLLPKKYNVEIKKEGFYDWKKTLEIREREVTEAKNIVLVPKDPEFNLLFKGVTDFFFSPDEKKIIIREESDKEQGWALKLFELGKNVKSHLIDEENISTKGAELIDLKFSLDTKRILLEVGAKEKLMYYLLEIDKTPTVLTPLDFLGPIVEQVYFNLKDSQKLLALSTPIKSEESKDASPDSGINKWAKELSEVDLVNKKISPPVLENIITCSVLDNNIYYLDTSGFLFKTDFSFNRKERLNVIPFSLRGETEHKIAISDSYILLKESDVLYILDEDKKSFEKIFETIKDFKFSPDSKKLVYFNDYEIWVLFLEKITDSPQKEARERLFITRLSEKIDKVFWYTSHYLIFNAGNKIKIAEIDDRDRINIVDLADFKEPEIFWTQNDKKLYILTEENLYTSEKLAP